MVSVPSRGFRQAEEHLDQGVHVATVAEVLEPDKTWATQAHQRPRARLTYLAPVVAHVEVHFHFGQSPICLLHLHDVDSPMGEMLGELWVLYHVVFVWGVRVNVRALWRDRAQLHHQGVHVSLCALLSEVVEGPIATARAVPEFPAAT